MSLYHRHVVIGASGFVGQHLVEALQRRGEETVSFDLVQSPVLRSGTVKFIAGDVRRREDLAQLGLRRGDIVYHLAARQFHGRVPSRGRDAWFADVNVGGTACLLQMMQEGGADALVFFSTDMVYGRPKYSPVPPDHPRHALGPYGRSKMSAEDLIGEARGRGLRATIFRPRLISGAGRLGILTKLFGLIKHGLPVPLIGDGRNRYQMVSVGDCATAALLARDHGFPAGPFNLGSDDPPTVHDLLQSMINRIGSRSILVRTPAQVLQRVLASFDRIGLTLLYPEQFMIADMDCVLDTTRTTAVLGWTPRDGDLDMLLAAYTNAVSGAGQCGVIS